MSISEVNSRGPKDQAVSREAEAGGRGRAGFQWVHVLTLVWTAGSPRSSLTPNTQNGPPPSCRVAKEPAPGAWAVSPGGTVYCSGGGKCPMGKGTQPHGRQSRGWEGAGDKKFEPKLSRAGAEGGGACACPTRDARRSWVALSLSALLEGPAAALPGHAQTRACPVDLRQSHSGAPAPQPHTTDLGLSGGWAPAVSPLASCLPWPWQPFWSLAPTAEAAGSQTPSTCGHPGSQRCRLLTPGTLLSKVTSVSQATLGCLSCTTSRPLCSRSCAQSISVTGKACCWVSSLTLTTKSTSDVSSRQPSCSWPEPLTRTTSRAMCTSGLPRDWSIFLCQRRKVRPQPAWERCSPLRAHGLNQSEGPHQSHHVILKCVTVTLILILVIRTQLLLKTKIPLGLVSPPPPPPLEMSPLMRTQITSGLSWALAPLPMDILPWVGHGDRCSAASPELWTSSLPWKQLLLVGSPGRVAR